MAELDDASDEELLSAYFYGNAKAYDVFFKRHVSKVIGYGVKRGLSEAEANDVTQEIFVKLHHQIDQYEMGRPALAWFYKVVKHTYVDIFRKNDRRIKLERQHNPAAHLHPDHETIDALESYSDEVDAGMKKLSTDQKSIVEMRVVNELSFKEISQATGKSEASLRKTFERSLKTLRDFFKGGDND